MMWKEIIKAEYMDGYRVMVWFNDGVKKIVNLSGVVSKYPVFKSLSNLDSFRRFNVTDTLEWENGKIDIAPEYLYENGITA